MAKVFASVVAAGLVLIASAATAATGEYWEMTTKMEMSGMTMPGMTHKICVPPGGEKDPRNAKPDKDCEMTDVKISGNKSSWKMRCTKDGDVVTGSGEMTSTPDRSEGLIKMNSKDGNMTMNYVNKRLGGACDPDEMKKKVDAMVDSNNKQMAKSCEGLSTGQQWYGVQGLVLGKDAICGAKREQFCEAVRRDSGREVSFYYELKSSDQSAAKACGFTIDTAKKAICKSADINNADFNKQLRGSGQIYKSRLQADCPGEMKLYAEASRKRYCEGRGFTEKKQVSLADCLKGMNGNDEAMNTPDPDEPPVSAGKSGKSTEGFQIPGLPSIPGNANPTDAVIDGAKKLKNLFGF